MVQTCTACGAQFDRAPQARTCNNACRTRLRGKRQTERIELLLAQAKCSGAARAALAKGDLAEVQQWVDFADEFHSQYLALL